MAFKEAFQHFPTLQTDRLILRELRPEDAETYHSEQMSARSVSERAPWAHSFEMESVEKARASFEFARKAWVKKARIKWGICLKDSGRLIGQCELFDFANQSKAETGYWLGADYQRQGLMTECMRAVVAYGFGTMELHRIYANTAVENAASITMVKKVGFVQEGILRQDCKREETWGDTALLAILKSDSSTDTD